MNKNDNSSARSNYHNPSSLGGGSGGFCLAYHYEMISDRHRVGAFRRAIESLVPGKVVLESGTGTGIMSLMAARAGAKHVFATELDPNVARFARKNFESAGFGDRITLIEKSSTALTTADLGGERPEVLIAENLATWLVTEPQLQILNHLNREIAAESRVVIPQLVRNVIELANAPYRFEDLVDLRSYYFEFSGVAGPDVLSEPAVFQEIDFGAVNETHREGVVRVRPTRKGVINCVRLTSPLEFGGTAGFTSSDSLMPPVVIPLESDLEVRRGDTVELHFAYDAFSSWEQFKVTARLA